MNKELLNHLEYEILRQHRCDTERGGCTCGFIVYNVEHVVGMFRMEIEEHLPKLMMGSVTTSTGQQQREGNDGR